jgi:hypothetical protein
MERARADELEASLDRLSVATASKAADAQRDRDEAEAARADLAALRAAHAEAVAQSRQLSAREAELTRDVEGERRLSAGLRRALADKERQVSVLAAEVERLHGRPVPPGGGDAAPPLPGGASLDAAAVIDARLVTFRSLHQLVERNTQLLSVARSLADDLDASRQGAEARVAEARASEAADLEARIAELTDTCAALATEAAACKRAADEAARDGQSRDQASDSAPRAAAAELKAALDRTAALEAEVAALRGAAAEARSLQQQLEAARSAASSARSEAAAAAAQQQIASNAAAASQQQLTAANASVQRLSTQLRDRQSAVERLEGQLEQVGGWANPVPVGQLNGQRATCPIKKGRSCCVRLPCESCPLGP